MDVFLTAEKEVAPGVAYVADNVVELIYEVYPYGAVREAVVRKVRGGRAGFSLPFLIREGRGILFLAPAAPSKAAVERLETGTCLDDAELVINILTDWLRRNGCNVTQEQVLRYLTAREAWV